MTTEKILPSKQYYQQHLVSPSNANGLENNVHDPNQTARSNPSERGSLFFPGPTDHWDISVACNTTLVRPHKRESHCNAEEN